MDDKIEPDPKGNGLQGPATAWRPNMPSADSVHTSPTIHDNSETITMETASVAPIITYHDQEVQCSFEETREKPVQTTNGERLPTGGRLAILVICACMAVFLQALVSQ